MKKYIFLKCLYAVFAVFFISTSFGQSNSDIDKKNYELVNANFRFVPKVATSEDFAISASELFQGRYFRIIQFYEIPDEHQRRIWAEMGLDLVDYLPNNAYYAVIHKQFPISSISDKLRSIFPITRQFKLESEIYFNGIPSHAKTITGYVQLTVSYYNKLISSDLIRDLQSRQIIIKEHREYSRQLDIIAMASEVENLIALPYIQFIGAIPQQPTLETDNLAYRNSSSRANFLNTNQNGILYNGAGVKIAIGESGTVLDTIDFKGRFKELTSGSVSSHKEGCMMNASSAGNNNPEERSHAWGASVVSTHNENYPNLITNDSVRYFNHSYGYGISGGYISSARDHDLRILNYPNHIVSYSSGNVGDDPGYSPYNLLNGWGNITGGIKQNKNHLVVANLTPDDQILSWGCKGPATDGRILPHITLAGPEGTSYASPKAVGLLAQLEQAYKSLNNGNPSPGALMRSILFNTADDVGNPGPDFKTGYGRPNARRALHVISNNQYFSGTISNGNTNTHQITVPVGTKQVRVMMVWPDVAASVNANPTIVNNLNLSATSPTNATYLPWVLDPTPNAVSLNLPATRQIDNLNTIEQITVDNPDSGVWQINISGANVPFGPQTYFVSYEFVLNNLHMMSPIENERYISGKTYLLRWDSYGNQGTFTLEYQLNGGAWTGLAGNIPASSRAYSWTAPTINGIQTIKFRVKADGMTSESGVNYVGLTPDNFRITKVCNDSVTFSWSSVIGATAYKLYKLGNNYMEEVTNNITFNGNTALLTGQSTTSTEYYSLSAITSGNEGQRTIAISKSPGNFACNQILWTGTFSNNWFDGQNWSSGLVPTCSDNIVIPASATNQPFIDTIGATCGNITIESGASLTMNNTSASKLSVCGDWVNNGSFVRGLDTIDFTGTNTYQEISGTSTSSFYTLKVSKGSINRLLEIKSIITLHAPSNPLVINSGMFKLSSASTITPFTNSAGAELLSSKGIWNNGGTINYGNFSLFNAGILRISAGTTNIGTNSGNDLILWNGGSIVVDGGTLNVAGSIRPNSGTSVGSYKQLFGNVKVLTVGSSSTTRGGFEINPGVPFIWTGGTISIRRHTPNTTADVIISSSSATITGGELIIGDNLTPPSQTIRINSIPSIYNLTINSSNAPIARIVTNTLNILNDLSILGGTFQSNSLNVNIGRNWINNGNYISNNSNVTFNGYVPQQISGISNTSFYILTLNNEQGLSLLNPTTTINNHLQLNRGVITTGLNTLIISPSSTVNRVSGHIYGNLQKSFSNSSSSNLFEIGDSLENNYTPIAIQFNNITSPGSLTASTVNSDHPSISTSIYDISKSVNRHWKLSNNNIAFSNYNATAHFLNFDIDNAVNTAQIEGGIYSASTWYYPTPGLRTSNSTEILNANVLGDIQLAWHCSNYGIQNNIGTYTATVNHSDGTSQQYNGNDCSAIATITDASGGNVLGITVASAVVASGVNTTIDPTYIFGRRSVNINAASNGPSTQVVLYFSQNDFDDYNDNNPTYLDLPTSPTNTSAIPYIRIMRDVAGVKSYFAPTMTWNNTENRWEVAFNTNGLSNTINGTYYFYTMPDCIGVNVNNLQATAITGTSVTATWDAVTNPAWGWYSLQYSVQGSGIWINAGTANNNATNKLISGLVPNTTYELQIRRHCSSQSEGPWSASVVFSTPNSCFAPTGISGSNITSNSALINWNASTGALWYSIRYRLSPSGAWTVVTGTATNKALNGLASATAYDVQVATNCSNGQGPWSGTYTFTTLSPAAACPAPSGLAVTITSNTSATATWNAATGALWYTTRYRQTTPTVGAWIQGTLNGTSRNLTGLVNGETYEIQVASNCVNNQITWSNSVNFTAGTGATCTSPTGLTSTNVTVSTATISWTAVPSALWYTTRYRQTAPVLGSWISGTITGTSRNISGLAANASYEFQVNAHCGNTLSSGFSGSEFFNTSSNKESLTAENLQPEIATVYPNPFNHLLTVSFFADAVGETIVHLHDMSGRRIKSISALSYPGTNSIDMDMRDIAAGMYYIRVLRNNQTILNEKVIKQ